MKGGGSVKGGARGPKVELRGMARPERRPGESEAAFQQRRENALLKVLVSSRRGKAGDNSVAKAVEAAKRGWGRDRVAFAHA